MLILEESIDFVQWFACKEDSEQMTDPYIACDLNPRVIFLLMSLVNLELSQYWFNGNPRFATCW